MLNTSMTTQKQTKDSAYATALLRSLHSSGVQFLRYFTVDVCNNVRCKAKPVDHLLAAGSGVSLENQVSIASVCYAGLPYYADFMIAGTGMDARNVLTIQPDLNSFRILPYAKKSAMVMGNLLDQYSDNPSPLCTRGLLCKVVQEAGEDLNIAFVSSSL
jgi:glutamine synthetase